MLIDPWITRFPVGTYSPAGADPDSPITVDSVLIDRYVTAADQLLVTHAHYDHRPLTGRRHDFKKICLKTEARAA